MRPAEAGQAAAEGAGYARREKCLNVVEASGGGAALRGFVEREESLPALTGRAGGGIVQQIRFCGEAQQDGHRNASEDSRSSRTVPAGNCDASLPCPQLSLAFVWRILGSRFRRSSSIVFED